MMVCKRQARQDTSGQQRRKERRFSGQTKKKQMKMSWRGTIKAPLCLLTQTDSQGDFIQRGKPAKGQLSGWSRLSKRKNEEQKCDPQRDGEEVCGGGAGRGELREGAHLPLSCVSWPAVKSSSLPFSAGRPQGAIVPGWARETGTERGGQRFE